MDMRQLVGFNIKRVRKKLGMTQERFAELSGFQQHYLSEVENGKRNISIITLYELATALGVSPGELVRRPPKTKR